MSANQMKAPEALTRRARRRLAVLPPAPGAKWANFAQLSAYSGLSVSSIDKLARNGEFESFKPFPNGGRLGDVPSFDAMMARRAAEGPRFGELKDKPVAEGKRQRGRPQKTMPSPDSTDSGA